MATISTQSTALITFDILELILLQTDPQTLLTGAQQTCKTWFRTIQESHAIQKVLFFTPVNLSSPASKTKIQNPLLARKFPGFFFHDTDLVNSDCPPLLASLDMLKRPEKLRAYIRPEASWRRMLVQQPPIFRIGILSGSFAFAECYEFHEISANADGLRMGEFFELLLFNHDSWPLHWGTPDIIWWGNVAYQAWQRMQSLRNMTVESDLALFGHGASSCIDYDDMISEDVTLRDRIQSVYQELNIQPNPPADQPRMNTWEYSRWYD